MHLNLPHTAFKSFSDEIQRCTTIPGWQMCLRSFKSTSYHSRAISDQNFGDTLADRPKDIPVSMHHTPPLQSAASLQIWRPISWMVGLMILGITVGGGHHVAYQRLVLLNNYLRYKQLHCFCCRTQHCPCYNLLSIKWLRRFYCLIYF